MRIHLAADYLGYELARELEQWLKSNHEVIWHAGDELDEGDDYPLFAARVGQAVIQDEDKGLDTFGILVGGSGNGEIIAINKVKGIRAALIWNADTAALARDHNDANVAAIGARQHLQAEVLELIKIFIDRPFSGDERHVRRIGKIARFEQTGEVIY